MNQNPEHMPNPFRGRQERSPVPQEEIEKAASEKPKHIVEGAPMKSATERVKDITHQMAEKEDAAQEARRIGDAARAEALAAEHAELKHRRDEILQETAKSRHSKLA